jgi:hypothetical protein
MPFAIVVKTDYLRSCSIAVFRIFTGRIARLITTQKYYFPVSDDAIGS